MNTKRRVRKSTGVRLQTSAVATQEAPATPEQKLLESELRHINAELDYPASGDYTRFLRERKTEIEQKLTELKAGRETTV
jgi:hypothetical protein